MYKYLTDLIENDSYLFVKKNKFILQKKGA